MRKVFLWVILGVLSGAFAICSAQTAQPYWSPRQYFVDGSGNPCAGCSLFSYAAGTSTPQATYTSSSESSQNTNPVILDATGSAAIWIGTSAYKFVLIDTNGTTLWTADQVISPLGANSGPYLTLNGGTLVGSLTAAYFQFTGWPETCTTGQFVSGWGISGWVCGTPSVGGTAGGDLTGSYPNPGVARVNGASIPTSATVLGSNSSNQLISQTGTISNNTSGNAATATALASAPTNCGSGNTAYGIGANGNALCNTTSSTKTLSLIVTSGICTTGTSAFSQCTSTAATWPNGGFADTGYSVTCTGVNMTGNVTQLWVVAKTLTQVQFALQNGDTAGATASSFNEVDCAAVHP